MKAVGIHVFAGGFTMGVRKVFDVVGQLEIHNFGRETVEQRLKLPFMNASSWQEWPDLGVQFAYGNPRCTGFSTITSGYDDKVHGPWADQTKDVHDFCHYVVKHDTPIAIWESVQQAYTVGRPLLDYLRDELFVPHDYRIAHVFVNAASCGNAQNRRRYFFVAYKRDMNFNVFAPLLNEHATTLGDVLARVGHTRGHECKIYSKNVEYDEFSHANLTSDEWAVLPHLPQGCCMNGFARRHEAKLKEVAPRAWRTWDLRTSDMPFSLHCIHRARARHYAPTLHSSAGRIIHPFQDRPLTLGEIAAVMGWACIPAGTNPIPQLAKGVVPSVGTWLAEQAMAYLSDAWGKDDFESTYNDRTGVWEGRHLNDKPVEKVFNLTKFVAPLPEEIV